MTVTKQVDGSEASTTDGPTFRSSAVARMARMPVATLRIWEQRYQAVKPAAAASGHRLYSPADVQRVLLLRQLTAQGHAISALAALDTVQLQQLTEQACFAADGRSDVDLRPRTPRRAPLKLAVVGPALAARLQRPAVIRHLTHTAARLETFESLAAVAQAGERTGAQLLIWHAPELGPDALPALQAVQQAGSAVQLAVVYRYASSASTRALAAAGVASLREPADDDALGAWLASIEAGMSQQARKEPALETPLSAPAAPQLTPRRYDDATLTAIAGLSPTLACECPKHVAELLMQLSSFESYSAGCINRDAADARLHAYLQEVAAASRALFEAALERVARHEGLPLR